MAPDINSLPAQITDGYQPVQDDNRYVIPDIVLDSAQTRKVKVLSVGAGVSGIMMAYQIMKQCENVEHVIYEKNHDLGGTWLENRYPGCACDIPSHAYTFKFALNPDWPRFFSYSPDIWEYLNKVCEVWNLRKYMTFNTEVIGCYWKEEKGEWLVKLRETASDGSTREFEDTCNVLLHGTGILNNFKWPDIEGIEKFKGKIMHTARWPKDYQAEEWKKDRVAVIGSGASSIQTVPTMQPHVKHMDIFVRTGVWFVQIANNFGQNKVYTQEERDAFRHDKTALVTHAKSIEDQVNGLWGAFFKNSKAQDAGQETYKARMADFIKDKRLLDGFTPKWGLGCRRITPGDPYMEAIQKENVDVHFTEVTKIDETGVIGGDGAHREVDTIICATGFDVSYRPRFPIVGRDGVELADKWKVCPEGYLGLAVPGFPNFLTFIGPTWPVENGSVMGPLDKVADYSIQLIKKIQTEQIRGLAPRQDVTDLFNEHAQEWVQHTIWVDDCRSWYKNNETGRVNAVWPGSSLHYCHAISTPRYEDYEITYMNRHNMWAFLGMGTTPEQVTKGADVSPYLSAENIAPEWLEAVGHYGNGEVSGSTKRKLEEKEGPAGNKEIETGSSSVVEGTGSTL